VALVDDEVMRDHDRIKFVSLDVHAGSKVKPHATLEIEVDGALIADEKPAEYEKIYERFGTLLAAGESAVEAEPFDLVADAFMMGRRIVVDAFHE